MMEELKQEFASLAESTGATKAPRSRIWTYRRCDVGVLELDYGFGGSRDRWWVGVFMLAEGPHRSEFKQRFKHWQAEAHALFKRLELQMHRNAELWHSEVGFTLRPVQLAVAVEFARLAAEMHKEVSVWRPSPRL